MLASLTTLLCRRDSSAEQVPSSMQRDRQDLQAGRGEGARRCTRQDRDESRRGRQSMVIVLGMLVRVRHGILRKASNACEGQVAFRYEGFRMVCYRLG